MIEIEEESDNDLTSSASASPKTTPGILTFASNLRGVLSKSEGHVARVAMTMQTLHNAIYECKPISFEPGNIYYNTSTINIHFAQ